MMRRDARGLILNEINVQYRTKWGEGVSPMNDFVTDEMDVLGSPLLENKSGTLILYITRTDELGSRYGVCKYEKPMYIHILNHR